SLAAKRLLAIIAYYVVLAAALALTWRYSPAVRHLLTGTSLADLAAGPSGAAQALTDAPRIVSAESLQQQITGTLLALAGALITAIPVAWSYSLTRRRRGFAQSMGQILVLLPVAVAGMVTLIQSSVALAFSLAGIVAVLRFRNALDDVKDGVYIFVCISIGIAAALGALTIGLLTSFVFNAAVLTLWWLDFARRPTPGIRGGIRKLMRLPKIHLPRLPNARPVGSIAADGDALHASAASVWRSELQLTSRGVGLKGHVTSSLRIQTPSPDETRPFVEALLRERARHWRLIGIIPTGAEMFTLKYRVSVRRAERSDLLDAVRASSRVVGVEVR
ncbi:MAG: DUF4956 domain-containing protein, partial [Gemmatimonadaceae bacterium]